MSVRYSIASGNWTDSATWGLVDSTSYENVSDISSEVLTTAYSATRSSAFTPGLITVSHLLVKLSVRTGTTGTISVSLRNSTIGLDDFVAGTEVTINVADLPAAATLDLNGGWIAFKLASPVTLIAATAYNIQAKTSTASQVSLFRNSPADNIARCLVTTTTGAPVAGDDLIIAGEKTGAGTSNAFVVTMNETAATDYGSASTSLSIPAIAICDGGTLRWGTSASTAYQLKVSGNLIVYSGGAYNQGTVATPCPRDSTQDLFFDCTVNVDFGLIVRSLGTLIVQGQSRSSGKNVVTCKLNTDEAANSTSLGVDTDTGWLDNDEIVVASTTRTAAQCEAGTLNGSAGASTLTVDGFAGTGGGLLHAHGGVSPVVAEVILLSRNVIIRGTSASLQSYVLIGAAATVDCDWVRFKWLGSATTNKRGIENGATTGTASFQFCSLDSFSVASSYGYSQTGTAVSSSTFSNNVIWNTADNSILIAATTGSGWTVSDNVVLNSSTTTILCRIADAGGVFSGNTFAGGGQGGVLTEAAVITGTFSNNTWHSNTSVLQILLFIGGTITNSTVWRTGGPPQLTNAANNLTIDGFTAFGNVTANLAILLCSNVTINNFVSNGDSTFSTVSGVNFGSGVTLAMNIRIANSTFGVVSGIKTAHTQDILCSIQFVDLILENCLLASASEVGSQTSLLTLSGIGSQKHDQVAGAHKRWKREGTLSIDTTIFDTSPSLRIAPLSASEKCTSDGRYPVFSAAVASGGAITVSCKVRESVVGDGTDYNGSRIRLIVKRNIAAGIANDTVLATATIASEGSFETISGTTAAVTDDAVLDFTVDCDGTTGWINVDTWTATPVADSLGLKYWQDGQPVAYGNNSSGSGGGMIGPGNLSGGFQ